MNEKKTTLDKITIVEQTAVIGEPAMPGDELSVPGDISLKDAHLLIGLGKALPGPADSANNKKAVEDAVAAYRKGAARSVERKKYSEPANVRLARVTEAIEQQGVAIMALAESVGQLLAAQVGEKPAKTGR